MTKHAKKSDHLQIVDLPKTATVEIPLPLLGAFANIERSFFDLCIDAGQQVLASMMEQDREDLCGPRLEARSGSKGRTRRDDAERSHARRSSHPDPAASGSEPGGPRGGAPELRVRREPGSARSADRWTPWPAASRLGSTPEASTRCPRRSTSDRSRRARSRVATSR